MRPPELLKYLYEISEACRLLRQFTAGKTLAEYKADPMLRSAVERQFEVIGEALRLALRTDPTLAARISDAGRIISFRNRLIHGYATVSDDLVWGVLESHLPGLESQVELLMRESGR